MNQEIKHGSSLPKCLQRRETEQNIFLQTKCGSLKAVFLNTEWAEMQRVHEKQELKTH